VSGVGSLIEEIEASFKNGTAESRSVTLRRITNLFLDGADAFAEPQIEVFDDVLCQLVDKIEREAIVELSTSLAPIAKAPPDLTRHLSRHEDIAISGPVLRQSPLLTDDDLVEIAQNKSQQHLAAIAGRRQISEVVTDVLVDRGDSEVLTTVAGNFGARFSPNGYGTLLTKAEQNADVAMAVVIRSDLSPEMFRKLVSRAATTVQQRLQTIANPTVKDRLRGVLQDISLQILRDADGKKISVDARRNSQADNLDKEKLRAELHEYASAFRLVESATALGTLSGVSSETIKRLISTNEVDALLIVCKASGLGWRTARAMVNLCAKTKGNATANPTEFLDQYTKMTSESAQRVMRFLSARKAVSGSELKKLMIAS
jgi:uncharacterized protein (DUF2336 family)